MDLSGSINGPAAMGCQYGNQLPAAINSVEFLKQHQLLVEGSAPLNYFQTAASQLSVSKRWSAVVGGDIIDTKSSTHLYKYCHMLKTEHMTLACNIFIYLKALTSLLVISCPCFFSCEHTERIHP